MDCCFGQVSRALEGGASGPETFTLLVSLLCTHFDRVDTGASYAKLHTKLACLTVPPFAILAGNFAG